MISASTLLSSRLETPLGAMIVIANDHALYLLEFIDRRGWEAEVERLRRQGFANIVSGTTPAIISIEQELKAYFDGSLKAFKTPVCPLGSPFQKKAWSALAQVPYAQTRSYLEQAIAIGHPKACRAVANANGANAFAIRVPCHRIINTSGELGGYGGGIARKQWLIQHELSTISGDKVV